MGTSKIPITARLAPDIKSLATKRAREQNRSFASYLEWLILQDVNGAEGGRPGTSANKRAGAVRSR